MLRNGMVHLGSGEANYATERNGPSREWRSQVAKETQAARMGNKFMSYIFRP